MKRFSGIALLLAGIAGSVLGASGTTGSVTVKPVAALADGTANPTAAAFGSYTFVWNGTTWDRVKSPSADAVAATGLFSYVPFGWNGATYDRFQMDGSKNLKVTLPTRTETMTVTRNSAGNIIALATSLNAGVTATAVVVDLTGHLGGVLQFTQVFPNNAPSATTGLVVQIGYNVSGSNTSDTQYFTTWTLASVQNATQVGSIRLDGGYKYVVSVKNSDASFNITYGITLDTNDRVTN